MKTFLTVTALAALAAGSLAVAPASAKIHCKDGFQHIRGEGFHASPYCEIKYLYKIARRSYGIRTSFRKLKNSVAEREEVCQAVGHDHRVYSTCLPYRNDGGNRRIN